MTISTLNNYSTNPFSRIARNIAKAYKTNRNIRITTPELSGLSDRELNDLGLARGDIYSIARGDTTRARHLQIAEESNENLKGWV